MHDLAGQTFGRLKALWRNVDIKSPRVYWYCRCTCGGFTNVSTDKLRNGNTKSCGCLAQEMRGQHRITHGATRGQRSTWDHRAKMIYAARARAKKAGVPFEISVSDLAIPDTCPVLGMHLVRDAKQCQPDSPSLDRIIPERGYVQGNVRIISHKANTIKSNATVEELKKVLEYLESNQG